mmetsp:Transcript_43718/g.108628  ORF Transcript_43718/g.108628 Transcript_43718/m.108628 type:complete len:250 (-) Transcript_43718:1001-1750(-)
MLVHSYIHSDAYATERANEYAAARAGVRDGRQSPEEFGASRESPGGREGRFEGECWSVCREGDGELERRNDAPKSAPKLAAIVASILRARDAGPSGAVAKVGRRQRTLANVPIRDEFRTHTSRADIRVSIGGGGRFRSDFENRREIRGGNRQTGISPPSEFGNRWESPRSTSVRQSYRTVGSHSQKLSLRGLAMRQAGGCLLRMQRQRLRFQMRRSRRETPRECVVRLFSRRARVAGRRQRRWRRAGNV